MKLVQRANKQLWVPDDKLDDYLSRGYRAVEEKPQEKSPRKART